MIPEEAVEAATDALQQFALTEDRDGLLAWDAYARAALETAAPYIMALALDKAAEDAEGLGMDEIPVHSLRHRAACYRTYQEAPRG